MLTRHELLKLEIAFAFFFVGIRAYCPFCSFRANHKTKTYDSIYKLSWHVSRIHRNDTGFPFTCEQILELLKMLAKILEWGILPYEKSKLAAKRSEMSLKPRTQIGKEFA